jgi:hypothetical protein
MVIFHGKLWNFSVVTYLSGCPQSRGFSVGWGLTLRVWTVATDGVAAEPHRATTQLPTTHFVGTERLQTFTQPFWPIPMSMAIVYIYIFERTCCWKLDASCQQWSTIKSFRFCGLCENCHPYPHIPQGSNMPRCWLDCSSQTLGTSISLRIYMVIIIYGAWHTHM